MIRLIVDSTFGIQKHYAEKHNIKIVRLKMILGEEVFDEGFEDTYDAFYEKMKKQVRLALAFFVCGNPFICFFGNT